MTIRFAKLLASLPVVAIVCATAGSMMAAQPPQAAASSLDIAADAPAFDSTAEFIAHSDLIVIARAEREEHGRLIGDPTQPNSAIRTRLVTMKVGEVLHGTPLETFVLEEEAQLLDGTPITVNGVQPTTVGDEGLYFLTRNKDPQAPFFGLVNHQSRYLITKPNRSALVPSSPDRLSMELATLGPYGLRCQVLMNSGKERCNK